MGPTFEPQRSLQGLLAENSLVAAGGDVWPHHPITCFGGPLAYDGRLVCDHAVAPKGDPRTRAALNHTVAVLLMELARERFG